MIYEIPISATASLERKVSKYIRKWFGLHRSLSPIALYSKQSPCPLPISSLVGIEKTAKAGALLQLRDSADPLVSGTSPSLRAGRTWSIVDAVTDAESILYFRKLLGSPAKGRCGLGYIPRVPLAPKGTKEHRKAVCDTLFEEHDKHLLDETIQKYANATAAKGSSHSNELVTLQLHWSYWCDYIRNDLSWKAIWAMGPDLMRFAVQSTFNTMSCPKNRVRWRESSDPSCDLCSHSPCTIPHILSDCRFSLESGRYTFRHDSVVNVMVDAIKNFINKKKTSPPAPSKGITFVKAGAKEVKRKKRPPTGILDEARDWVLHCDLGGVNPTVPPSIAVTESRPDIFIYSVSAKYAITIGNTSGCEENFSARHEDKLNRYGPLDDAITSNGWKHSLFCVEVGARGYCANSVLSCFKSLGFSSKLARDTVKDLGLTAMKASFAIWLARADKSKSFQAVPHPPDVAKIGPLMNPLTTTSTSRPLSFAPSPPPSSHPPTVSHISKPTHPVISRPSTILRPAFSSSPIGLRNLGQTCYVNTILQSLAASFDSWSCIVPQDLSSAHFLKYLVSMMKLMKFRSSKVDPAHFVDKLGALISQARGVKFIVNRANDVPEVLGYILSEMLAKCTDSGKYIFSTTFKVDRSCDVCFSSSCAEEQVSMLRVPVRSTIQSSIQDFFKSSRLEGPNQRFCGVCGINQDATCDICLIKPPELLIIHLVRFTQVGASDFIKNGMAVHCDRSISLTESSSEPHTTHRYDLISVIEHSGPFDSGHYTCVVQEPRSGQFFFCNDSIVKPVDISQFKAPYVLFYRRCQLSV